MLAVMVITELENIGTVVGTDITLTEADPIIAEMMFGPAIGHIGQF